jgi:hypothetical protein
MANRYPLVLNGSTIEELQAGDVLIGVGAAVNSTNADYLLCGISYFASSIAADPNTIAARDGQADLYAAKFRGALIGDVTGNVSGSSGSCTGNSATATSLAGGSTGSIPYQSNSSVTAFLSPGTTGYVLKSNGAGNAPSWVDVQGLISGITVGDTTGQTGINLDLTSGTITGTCSGLTTSSNVQFASVQTTSLTTGGSSTAGTITGDWSLGSGSRLQSTYADLAEKYLADVEYEVGTVVVIGGEKEITASDIGQRAIGVVSAHPAYVMNSQLEGGTLIALKGRVPTRVQGLISKGDRMVASANGVAIKAPPGSADVFAISLESSSNDGVKLVEAVIL